MMQNMDTGVVVFDELLSSLSKCLYALTCPVRCPPKPQTAAPCGSAFSRSLTFAGSWFELVVDHPTLTMLASYSAAAVRTRCQLCRKARPRGIIRR